MADVVFLSPHLDDVALSCGGTAHALTAGGGTVTVVTVFAGDEPAAPPSELARELHRSWGGSAGVVAARRAEDADACRLLGATPVQLDFHDCIYRVDGGRALYPRRLDLFGPIAPADSHLVEAIAARLAAFAPRARLYSPLGVGHHVDHLLVRAAAERFATAHGLRLAFYEDYPYTRRWGALRGALGPRLTWRGELLPLSAADLGAKIEAIAAYRSQLRPLFRTRERLEGRITAAAHRTGGERFWVRRDAA